MSNATLTCFHSGNSTDESCLFPVADLFNHGTQGNMGWDVTNGRIIFTQIGFKAGTELTLTYRNDLSHVAFFFSHGFPIKDGAIIIPTRHLGIPNFLLIKLRTLSAKLVEQIQALECQNSLTRYHPGIYYTDKDYRAYGQCTISLDLWTCYMLAVSKSMKQVKSVLRRKQQFHNM